MYSSRNALGSAIAGRLEGNAGGREVGVLIQIIEQADAVLLFVILELLEIPGHQRHAAVGVAVHWTLPVVSYRPSGDNVFFREK